MRGRNNCPFLSHAVSQGFPPEAISLLPQPEMTGLSVAMRTIPQSKEATESRKNPECQHHQYLPKRPHGQLDHVDFSHCSFAAGSFAKMLKGQMSHWRWRQRADDCLPVTFQSTV